MLCVSFQSGAELAVSWTWTSAASDPSAAARGCAGTCPGHTRACTDTDTHTHIHTQTSRTSNTEFTLISDFTLHLTPTDASVRRASVATGACCLTRVCDGRRRRSGGRRGTEAPGPVCTEDGASSAVAQKWTTCVTVWTAGAARTVLVGWRPARRPAGCPERRGGRSARAERCWRCCWRPGRWRRSRHRPAGRELPEEHTRPPDRSTATRAPK